MQFGYVISNSSGKTLQHPFDSIPMECTMLSLCITFLTSRNQILQYQYIDMRIIKHNLLEQLFPGIRRLDVSASHKMK